MPLGDLTNDELENFSWNARALFFVHFKWFGKFCPFFYSTVTHNMFSSGVITKKSSEFIHCWKVELVSLIRLSRTMRCKTVEKVFVFLVAFSSNMSITSETSFRVSQVCSIFFHLDFNVSVFCTLQTYLTLEMNVMKCFQVYLYHKFTSNNHLLNVSRFADVGDLFVGFYEKNANAIEITKFVCDKSIWNLKKGKTLESYCHFFLRSIRSCHISYRFIGCNWKRYIYITFILFFQSFLAQISFFFSCFCGLVL